MNFELKNENSFRFDDEKQQNQISPNNQQAEPQIDYLMRLGFIRKVYGILSCQILITVIICGFTFNDNFRSFLSTNTYLFWMCLGIGLFTIFPLTVDPSVIPAARTSHGCGCNCLRPSEIRLLFSSKSRTATLIFWFRLNTSIG